jgi:16S rRNA (uracil1498-N3)-methyltransferase
MSRRIDPPGMPAFFLAPQQWHEPFLLKGPEQHHLRKVLRGRPGDIVRLLDGQGRIGVFEVLTMEKEHSLLRHRESWIEPVPDPQLDLAVGWNRSLRRSWLLEKAAELGCRNVLFWQAKRSQGQVPAQVKDGWGAQLLAGAKQSANPWLPSVQTCPGGVRELAEMAGSFDHRVLLWEEEVRLRLDLEHLHRRGSHLFVLGPEGGFDPGEAKELIRAGFVPMSLGERVLRWETAALLCLGLFWWSRRVGLETR